MHVLTSHFHAFSCAYFVLQSALTHSVNTEWSVFVSFFTSSYWAHLWSLLAAYWLNRKLTKPAFKINHLFEPWISSVGPTEGCKCPLRPVWIQLLLVLNFLLHLILSAYLGDLNCFKLIEVVWTGFELVVTFLAKCLFISAYLQLLIAPICLLWFLFQ